MDVPSIDLDQGQLAFLELLGIAATVVAAFLAAGAIIQSGRQAAKSSEALRRERRLDFELDTLRDLADLLVGGTEVWASVDSRARALLLMLPAEGLQVTRATFDLDGSEATQQFHERVTKMPGLDFMHAELDGARVKDLIGDEVIAAIGARVESRV